MEQVFIIVAIVIFWIFKGVAGARRRAPGQDPYESESLRPTERPEIAGPAGRGVAEAQQRALEALQRWEAKQGLSRGEGASQRAETVPAASRTRAGRPATFQDRAAQRQRKQAYADIAGMLDPNRESKREASPQARPSLESPVPASSWELGARTEEAREERQSRATPAPSGKSDAEVDRPAVAPRAHRPRHRPVPAALRRIETLPFAARAIVYSEIFGHPRSLS